MAKSHHFWHCFKCWNNILVVLPLDKISKGRHLIFLSNHFQVIVFLDSRIRNFFQSQLFHSFLLKQSTVQQFCKNQWILSPRGYDPSIYLRNTHREKEQLCQIYLENWTILMGRILLSRQSRKLSRMNREMYLPLVNLKYKETERRRN